MRDIPLPNFNFTLTIDGIAEVGFFRVDGIESSAEVSRGNRVRVPVDTKIGERSFANLVLRRGYTGSKTLWEWHRAILQGEEDRRDVAIELHDEQMEPVVTLRVSGAWPCRWKLGPLDAVEGGVLVEEIELVVADMVIR